MNKKKLQEEIEMELDVRVKAKNTDEIFEGLEKFRKVFDVQVTSRFKENKGEPGVHCFVILKEKC